MSTIYGQETWNQYAPDFLALMPSMMLELNKAVASLALGNVCDFGSGAAKIAPFLLERDQVTSYTGIDYSLDMVELGRWHLKQFPGKSAKMIHSRIESLDIEPDDIEVVPGLTLTVPAKHYDFGLSINSYYAWDNPEAVLKAIHQILSPDARFVLVTPNPQIDIVKILQEVKKEQVANPYFESFKEKNLAIAGNERAWFIEMHDLIAQVQRAGFKVIEANQNHYSGGLNFLHLSK